MKDNNGMIKSLFIASLILFLISIVALIINLIALEGVLQNKEISNIVVCSISFVLVVTTATINIIKAKKK